MKDNKGLLIMMATAAVFLAVMYYWVNKPKEIPPKRDFKNSASPIQNRIDTLSKTTYDDNTYKDIMSNIEDDANLIPKEKDDLKLLLENGKSLSLVHSYNTKKDDDCGDVSNRSAIYNRIINQQKKFKLDKGINLDEFKGCIENYTKIVKFNYLQGRINSFKSERFEEIEDKYIRVTINDLNDYLGGCLEIKKQDYLRQLDDFKTKEKLFEDYKKNKRVYERTKNNLCEKFKGYKYYLITCECQ